MTCSLIVKGPVLKVHSNPNVLNVLIGITFAHAHPIG